MGGLEGDEAIGPEVLVRFIRHVVEGWCINTQASYFFTRYAQTIISSELHAQNVKVNLLIRWGNFTYMQNLWSLHNVKYFSLIPCIYFSGHRHHDSRIDTILEKTNLHIIPAFNVDGLDNAMPGDCTGQQYFGEKYSDKFNESSSSMSTAAEVQALKTLFTETHFHFVISLGAGGNYIKWADNWAILFCKLTNNTFAIGTSIILEVHLTCSWFSYKQRNLN